MSCTPLGYVHLALRAGSEKGEAWVQIQGLLRPPTMNLGHEDSASLHLSMHPRISNGDPQPAGARSVSQDQVWLLSFFVTLGKSLLF